MTATILYSLAIVFSAAAAVIMFYLYRTSDQRNLGVANNGRQQGIQLIIWFAFLGLLLNVILERLVEILDENYVLVMLPTLLLMVATMLFILFQKVPKEE